MLWRHRSWRSSPQPWAVLKAAAWNVFPLLMVNVECQLYSWNLPTVGIGQRLWIRLNRQQCACPVWKPNPYWTNSIPSSIQLNPPALITQVETHTCHSNVQATLGFIASGSKPNLHEILKLWGRWQGGGDSLGGLERP